MVYTRRVYSSPFYIKTILKHIYSNNPRTLTELPGRKTQRSGQHADCSSWSHTPNTKHIVPSSQVAPRRTKLCFSVCFSIPPRCTPGIQSNTPKAPSHEQGWLWSSCSAQNIRYFSIAKPQIGSKLSSTQYLKIVKICFFFVGKAHWSPICSCDLWNIKWFTVWNSVFTSFGFQFLHGKKWMLNKHLT